VRSIPKEQMERRAAPASLHPFDAVHHPAAGGAPHDPPLINQFLNLMKNSSLAMTIGVMS